MTIKEALENKNIIFKSLMKLDKDCRDHFNDNDVSNEEYFLYGIKLDLASNLMAIFLNDQICGIGSFGIELNARNVLEAIAILNCHERGELDQHNYDLYRDSYLPIEYSNESVIFKYLNKNHPEAKIVRERNEKLEEFYKKWMQYYKCNNKQELKTRSRDSLFYLQKYFNTPIFPNRMVKKYVGPMYAEYHEFLGFLLHPASFEESLLDIVGKQRFNMIMSIYLYALDYLKNKGYLHDNDMPTFDDFKKQKIIAENLNLIDKEIKILSKLNYDTTHYLDGSIDYFYWRTIGTLICLVRDIEVCGAFGFYEQAVIKFKIFIETIAVFSKVSGVEQKDYAFMKKAFRLSTTYQISEFIKNQHIVHIADTSMPDEPLINLYNEHIKEKYPDLKLRVFIDKIKHDSLFFIYLDPHEKKSYRRAVKDYTNDVLLNNALATNTFNLYQISLDIGHSCGYAFNASRRVWDKAPKEIMYLMYGYLGIHFKGGQEFFKDKKDKINFPNECIAYLDIFIEAKKKIIELEIQKEIEEQNSLKNN